jgi:SpoIID/LytB domain protein
MEALKVQAVAARGQLLAKVGTRHRADPYLLCAETHCQAYRGDTKASPRTDQAVKATRGELLFDDEGLVDTVYSSSCGGHTEAYHVFWGGPSRPALPGVHDVDDGANTSPVTDPGAFIAAAPKAWCSHNAGLYRWEKTLTGAFVSKAVAERAAVQAAAEGKPAQVAGEVHTIEVLRRGVSGRALDVAYVGTAGRVVVEGEYKNRTLLGRLRSGLWVVERRGGAATGAPAQWVFRGGGFGHGVGMCQHGAIGQADAGRGHETILKHYYRGSTLRRAW